MEEYTDIYEPEEEPKQRRVPVALIIALSTVVLLAAAGVAFFFLGGRDLIPLPEQTTTAPETTVAETTAEPTTEAVEEFVGVPYVVGLSADEAYSMLNKLGIKYTVSRQFSDTVPKDTVISQSPTDGEIGTNDRLLLYLSKGVENTAPVETKPKKSKADDKSSDESSTEETKKAAHAEGYVIPGSDSRYISASELAGLSKQDLNYALNEIYARHGRMFVSTELQNYFNSQPWYNGTIPARSFNEGVLNKYERANVATIVKYMESMGYR